MSENQSPETEESPQSDQKIDRRSALRKLARVGAGIGAMATISPIISNELQVVEKGVETNQGIFMPLYERHDEGIDHKDIPPDLDGFFREGMMSKAVFDGDIRALLSGHSGFEMRGKPGSNTPLFPNEVLDKLAKTGTKILFGDLALGNSIKAPYNEQKYSEALAEIVVGMTPTLIQKIQQLIDLEKLRYGNPIQTRRSFFKKLAPIGLGVASLGMIKMWDDSLDSLIMDKTNSNQKDAISRIYERLIGIVEGNLSPNDHVLFFRSVVMTDKILTAAEYFQKKTGHKPKIAFNVGARHTIMEDLLRAGPDFNRWLISQYPEEFLNTVIKISGNLNNFSGLRTAQLPQDFSADQFSKSYTKFEIQESRIIDQELYDIVDRKLNTHPSDDKLVKN